MATSRSPRFTKRLRWY